MSLQILRKGENEMAKKEVKTDLWVARQLDDSKIKYDAQGSDVKEINDALQSASKRGTGNAGYQRILSSFRLQYIPLRGMQLSNIRVF